MDRWSRRVNLPELWCVDKRDEEVTVWSSCDVFDPCSIGKSVDLPEIGTQRVGAGKEEYEENWDLEHIGNVC